MIALVDPGGGLLDFNAAFEAHKKNFPELANLYDLVPPEEVGVFREWFTRAHRIEHPARQLIRLLGEGGESTCFEALILPLSESKMLFVAEAVTPGAGDEVINKLTRQVRLFRVESEQAKKIAINKQVELQAIIAQANELQHVDQLTSLPNRRWLMKALQTAVMQSEEYSTPLSVSMLDVDHFKNINDTYGHIAGDEALQQIADHLRGSIRRYLDDDVRDVDTAGRYGGEEFLILLPNTPIQAAMRQAARLCEEIRNLKVKVGDASVHLTVSIGIAELMIADESWQMLLDRADKALYQAKEQGRDRWVAIENQ